MKTTLKTILCTALVSTACYNTSAQIKIKKPTIDVKTPAIGNGGTDKSSGSGSNTSLPGKDPSGLFSNCSDNTEAKSYRWDAVDMLKTLEGELAKTKLDYNFLKEKIDKNEKTLANLLKVEPKVNADAYNERYLPIKKRVEEEFVAYTKIQELEKLIAKEYSTPYDLNKVHVPSYQAFLANKKECYCSRQEETKSFQEYIAVKKEYNELNAKLAGYKNEITQSYFTRMADCIEGGNKYALWVAKENFSLEVVSFNENEKPLHPESVIEKCTFYSDALVRLENDKSLELSVEVKAAITEAKKQVVEIKTEAERYISSGDFEKHKAKVHHDKIVKEFLPKAVATNTALTSGAMKFVSGETMKNYLASRLNHSPVATTLKANLTTEKMLIRKNALDIPIERYHEIWVAYKDTEGRCYKVLVYAEYAYLGGGQYESTPTYSATGPIEMACENVNK